MTSVARQIGNAVPRLLAERIAEAVAAALDSTLSQIMCEPGAVPAEQQDRAVGRDRRDYVSIRLAGASNERGASGSSWPR